MIWCVIVLGAVQGLAEFLPVSSSGHLVLLNKLFGIKNDFLLLSVILHLATLFSVVLVLRKEVWQIAKRPFGSVGRKLILASVPTIVIVLLFKGIIDKAFEGAFLPICFMITAVLIVVSEYIFSFNASKKFNNNKMSTKEKSSASSAVLTAKGGENLSVGANTLEGEITGKTAVIMGLAQGLAVFPAISRSGATICAGLALKKDRKQVARFSFLMSIPIIFASLIFEVYEYISSGQALTLLWYELLIGFIVAFISGLFAVKFMLKVVEKFSLIPFAVYLAVIAIVSLLI